MRASIFIKVLYAMLLSLFHIGFSNCSITKSGMGNSLSNQSQATNSNNVIEKLDPKLICIYDSAIIQGDIRDIIKDELKSKNIQSIEKESYIYQGKQPLLRSDTNARSEYPNKENQDAIKTINLVKSLFKNKLKINDPDAVKNFITSLLAEGHKIAIMTSCPSFLHTTIALLEKLELSENQIKDIIIMRCISKNHQCSIEELQRLTNTKSSNVNIVHHQFKEFLAVNGYTTFPKWLNGLSWDKILKKISKAKAKNKKCIIC